MPQLARKDNWFGVGEVDPYFYVDVETFTYYADGTPDTRWRPRRIRGGVWNVGGRPRDGLIALPDIRGDRSLDVSHPNFSVGGHLIAVMLTGVDDPQNIVPVSKATNDKMSAVERDLGGLMDPHWLEVEVTGYYDDPDKDSRVPKGFHYRVYKGGTDPAGTKAALKEWNVTQDWLQVGPYGYPEKDVALAKQLQTGLKFGWKIENVTSAGNSGRDLRFLTGHLPPVGRRPLAFLDYWLIAYSGLGKVDRNLIEEYIQSIGLGTSFGLKWVRELAIKANILAHDNHLISDAFGDKESAVELKDTVVIETHQNLIVGGGANAPHIDHIVPESLGGPNCFSNAKVTSMQYNVQKGNQTKQFQFRDDRWREEMLQKLTTDPNIKWHT
jgi:5-methylcytosine-specific restriction endonuclease McrA